MNILYDLIYFEISISCKQNSTRAELRTSNIICINRDAAHLKVESSFASKYSADNRWESFLFRNTWFKIPPHYTYELWEYLEVYVCR